MTTREKLKEVNHRLQHATSPMNRRDLMKYKKRLLKELKKES